MLCAQSDKGIWFCFWLTSNRGTDEEGYRFLYFESVVLDEDGGIKEEDIKDELENWCSQFGAWGHDGYLKYGFSIKVPPREWMDKLIEASKKRIKDEEEHLGWLRSELSRLFAPDSSAGK